MSYLCYCRIIFICCLGITPIICTSENVIAFTVATEANDGYERYIHSANHYGINVQTLALGKKWLGGDMSNLGGGYKVNLLREAIRPYKNNSELIILFTDSYDVIFTSGLDDILTKFKALGSGILFGAEHFCWPNSNLKDQYPMVIANGARYLNSGMFIGYASFIYDIISQPIKDLDDDQLYFTNIYLDESNRKKYKIHLDHKSEIFQNLNGALSDVKLNVDSTTKEGTLQNINFLTTPSVIHGNGPSKIYLNAFANYLGGAFSNNNCQICETEHIEIKDGEEPIVTLAVFVENPVPFFEEFLDGILSLNYPKQRINFIIHCRVQYHDNLTRKFFKNFGKEYKTAKVILSEDNVNEREARKIALNQAQQKGSDYFFSIDADVHIDDADLLRDLIQFNKSFVAPVLSRTNELWSNFWGALSESGYYARSHDYIDIVKGTLKGMWNVPYVSSCFIIKKSKFKYMQYDHESFDPDMALCEGLRNNGIFMYVTNVKIYGHLINNEDFNIEKTRPDFYTLLSNQADWEQRYINPMYIEQFNPNFTHKQPCPDVYWFPIVTERFCKDLVAIMEKFGKWSDGSNSDSRIESGYEAVPTRDIHMNQVGLEKLWLRFLSLYVRPLQEHVFTGYYHNPPKSLMNFVVRYKPDEQPFLRPHHDSSTYTINIALNQVGIDYEGGGCRFLRYNCSVKATKMGWMLMHPGRLTHFHEGLPTTKGIRYIMVSFIDP